MNGASYGIVRMVNHLRLVKSNGRYEFHCTYKDRLVPKSAGLTWDPDRKVWFTTKSLVAANLIEYSSKDMRDELLESVGGTLELSRATDADIYIPSPAGLEYLPFQKAGVRFCIDRKDVLLADEMGLGKAQPVDQLVATPNGWKRIGALTIGDYVFNEEGEPTRVVGTYRQGIVDTYRITFTDGSSTESSDEHLWEIIDNGIMTTKELLESYLDNEYRIPVCKPVRYSRKELPIDPYTLGLLLDRGCDDIPEVYLTSSISQRIELLKGLLKDHSNLKFTSHSLQLVNDVRELVESLGGIGLVTSNRGRHIITIDFPMYRTISSIDYVGKKDSICIKVESDRGLYLTNNYIVTHNTIQAIGVINYMKLKNILVICPASLKINWANELSTWLVDLLTIYIVEGSEVAPDANVHIVNYDILGKHDELLRPYDLIVIDECHYIKNSKTIRSKRIREIMKVQRDSRRLIMVTGTPILNRPVELFNVLRLLNSDLGKNYITYTKRYCAAYNGPFGMVVSGASNLPELNTRLRSTVMIRRLKEDVLTELPEKRRQLISIPGDPSNEEEWWDDYESRRAELLAEVAVAKTISDEAYKEAIKKLRFELKVLFKDMSRLRHDSAVRKLGQSISYIKDTLENVHKLVIFAHHHDVINPLVEELSSYGVVKIDGTTSTSERDEAVRRFQNDDKVRVFIGGIKAAGVGLTLTAASTAIFIEFDWSPGVMVQAEDRIHRITQKYPVLIQYLLVDGTIDSKLAKTSGDKQTIIDAALDSDTEDIDIPDLFPTDIIIKDDSIESFTDDERIMITDAIKYMAMLCDGAISYDGSGFNRVDANIGRSLASFNYLTDKQLSLSRKILKKYREQIPEEIYDSIYRKEDV